MSNLKKILVLGSNSFSGQDFIDLLLSGSEREIIGVSRSSEKSDLFLKYRRHGGKKRFRFFQMDLNRDTDALLNLIDLERPDAIVNFAAQSEVEPSWETPEHWLQTNTVSLSKIINYLARQSYLKRYLHVSSPEAYGSCEGRVTEDTPDKPSTPYAVSKAAADMIVSVYAKQFGFPAITVRSTNVYGAHQQLFKIIPRSIIYIRRGEKIQLHGGGVAVKSYIHIRDVSRGELEILEHGQIGNRYHLSPDRGVAVRELVGNLAKIMGKSLEDVTEDVAERPGQDAVYVIDSCKSRKEFSWAPQVLLQDGLAEVVEWIESNWSEIKLLPLEYKHKA